MSVRVVTVFGGTGFLGRRVVRHLREHEFSVRIASRHPDRSRKLFGSDDPCLQSVEADIRDERRVADVLVGAYAAVNAVSLYVERGQETFHSVHVEAAERVAVQAHRVGVERLAHVSGLGADAASPSLYIRKRGEGELAVKAAFTEAILIRPAVMFGPDDTFLTTILELLRRLPIYPMFGRGRTRLQPAYVEDVAAAIALPRAGGGVTRALAAARSCQTAVKKAAMRLNEQSRGRDHQSSDEGGQTRKQHEVAQEHTHTRPLTFAAWPPCGIQKVDCGKRSGSKASCRSGRTRPIVQGARRIGSK
jgi:uncharacterized protein YbjT (DUF2867 family)